MGGDEAELHTIVRCLCVGLPMHATLPTHLLQNSQVLGQTLRRPEAPAVAAGRLQGLDRVAVAADRLQGVGLFQRLGSSSSRAVQQL